MLAHITDTGTDDRLYVCEYDGLIRHCGQISIHNLSSYIHMVFLRYESFDGLLDDLIWYMSWCSLLVDNGE